MSLNDGLYWEELVEMAQADVEGDWLAGQVGQFSCSWKVEVEGEESFVLSFVPLLPLFPPRV